MSLLDEINSCLNNLSVCLQRAQALPTYLRIVLSALRDLENPILLLSFRCLSTGWKNLNKILSAKHCSAPSKKEGQCLLCDNSFSQTMNQPHCPTRLCASLILLITTNGKGRNMTKKLRLWMRKRT